MPKYQNSQEEILYKIKQLEHRLCCKTQFYDTVEDFPAEGEDKVIYVDESTGAFYIWNGTEYVSADSGIDPEFSGSGELGQVAYFSGTNSVIGSNNLFWDEGPEFLGIGTNTPSTTLQVQGAGSTFNLSSYISTYGSVTSALPAYTLLTSSKAFAAGFGYGGSTNATFPNTALIYTDTGIDFRIVTAGTQAARFSTSQNIFIGTSNVNPTARLQVRGSGNTSGTTALLVENSTPTTLLQVLDNGRISQTLEGTSNSTAFGTNALRVATGSDNTAFGSGAGFSIGTSVGNSFFGKDSGYSTTGANNSFFGRASGLNNTTGANNSFFGRASGGANSTGSNNSFFGTQAASSIITGSNNVALGYFAGQYITGGSTANTISNQSIFIGSDTRANADNETNQIVIGYQTTGLGSNTTNIGNSSTTQTNLYGNLTLGTTTSGGRLTVRGSGTTSATTALLVQNSGATELFKITDDGFVRLGNQGASASSIFSFTTAINVDNINGRNLGFYNYNFNGDLNNGSFGFSGVEISKTSGITIHLFSQRTFSPTSGTASFANFQVNATINQTGGANGITRGLYVNPTLTAAADWRGLEISTPSNSTIYAGRNTGSAALQIDSTVQGFLPPRVTTAERDLIATPAAGLVIFNTTTTKLECYDGAVWQAAW